MTNPGYLYDYVIECFLTYSIWNIGLATSNSRGTRKIATLEVRIQFSQLSMQRRRVLCCSRNFNSIISAHLILFLWAILFRKCLPSRHAPSVRPSKNVSNTIGLCKASEQPRRAPQTFVLASVNCRWTYPTRNSQGCDKIIEQSWTLLCKDCCLSVLCNGNYLELSREMHLQCSIVNK